MLPSREFTWKSAKSGARRDVHTVLNSQVLVLNRLWQAVNICSARRAFALVYFFVMKWLDRLKALPPWQWVMRQVAAIKLALAQTFRS